MFTRFRERLESMTNMPPSRRNTSGDSSEPPDYNPSDAGGQARFTQRSQVAHEAVGVLFIGSHVTIEKPIIGLRELRSIQPHIHSSYAMPSDTVLARIHIVYGYDLEDERRVHQLRHCSEYQRKHGNIQTIYAFLRVLDVNLAEQLEAFGIQVKT